jgi:DNA polymerase-3 subunit alpha
MRYVSLHHHSTFSFCDGYDSPEAHVARAAELEMPALALTEHGNVSSHVRLEKAAKAAGIRPIFGVEAYTAGQLKQKLKWHLTILAENAAGYRNLLSLVSRGWEQFYFKETILSKDLKEFGDGLVVLSGCSGSFLASLLVGGKGVKRNPKSAEAHAGFMRDIFGDRYYLEVQAFPELDRTKEINGHLERISRKLGIPLVATGDVHYPKPDDNVMQRLLHGIGRGAKTDEGQSQDWEYDVKLTFYDDAEVYRRLVGSGLSKLASEEAIRSTMEVAERCAVELPKVEPFRFPVEDSKTTIWEWLREGWRYRAIGLRTDAEKYAERIRYEMEIIEAKGFIDYFLLIADAVQWTKNNGYPVGPARGSVAASVVSYILRITEVDPVVFDMLMFERFIDINRNDLPDIDLDFDDETRWRTREYLVGKYGADKVGNIGTFTKFKGKLALSHVGRLHGIPIPEIEKVKDLLVERSGGDSRADFALEDTFTLFPEAAAILAKYPDLQKAMRLEGNYLGMSTHAAGLVVSSEPLTDYVAVYQRKDSEGRTLKAVSVDKYDAEELGVMKIDFLGLKNVGMLRLAMGMLGMKLDDLYAIPLDDEETLVGFRDNDVVGIFQFDGKAMRSVNAEVKPENFMDLAAVNALSRPGPLHSGSTYEYMDVRHGRRRPKELHPIISGITSWTRGQIIYQEQILQVLREVANFSWLNANKIRKVISKRLGESSFNELIGPWYDGCDANGIPRDRALEIWNRLVTAGTYAFNVAHAVSYTILGFWTMWLKRHHPQVFYVSMLHKFDDNEEKRRELLIDATRKGIEVRPPDLRESGLNWVVEGTGIRAGFQQLPGVGISKAEKIVAAQDELRTWPDLINVNGFGVKTVPALCEALDTDDFFGIFEMMRALDRVRARIKRKANLPPEDPSSVPRPTHRAVDVSYEDRSERLCMVLRVNQRNLRDVFEEFRAREGRELDPAEDYYKGKIPKSMLLYCEDETGRQAVNITRKNFANPELQKRLFSLRMRHSVILVRGMKKKGFRRTLFAHQIWAFDPDDDGGGSTRPSYMNADSSPQTSVSRSGNGTAVQLRENVVVGFEERWHAVR